ncbi:hypothetical protein [Robertmurraya siralis]|uniref:hypothetical protein n=1 Tax=Robertmurraya siralis TaxID=77777 RepID=UPI0010F9A4B6|nr:hypothetical protein [Robertmurraya siralis]
MNKKLTIGLVTGLLISNVATGYAFTKTYSEKNNIIKEQDSEINKLIDAIIEKNVSLDDFKNELNTYKIENKELSNTIQEQQSEINTLKKNLSKMKKREKESP